MSTSDSRGEDEQGDRRSPDPGPVNNPPDEAARDSDVQALATSTPFEPHPFPTVGIGASAGGLEALIAFLSATPAAAGVAIVIVTHQHPSQKSLLPELLARHSALPVIAAQDGRKLEPNRVYVSPPGKQVALRGGILRLSDRPPGGSVPLPIDHFFRSLAVDQEDHAICIVLSGAGTDGTAGLREVKEHGGLAIAQDQLSAQYPGMPMSAAATLLVDRVLPPREMPRLVLHYAEALRKGVDGAPSTSQLPSEAVHTILELLQRRIGHDFRGYKGAAVARRIERRMRVHQIQSVADYIRLLEAQPHELNLLFSELLISVTSFFRDGDAFRALAALLGARLAERSVQAALRVWVTACSTGEEAYSMAILLAELGLSSDRFTGTQDFATDIDPNVIEHARLGMYPASVLADLGAERLQRFFVREDRRYRVAKEIRELCVFATQSLIKDPPFTKLDLLSCRNLLIYLDAETQKDLIPLFHYALKPGGLLLLGTSEAIGGFEHLFKPVDRKHKIYERLARPVDTDALLEWRLPWPLPERTASPSRAALAPVGVALHSNKMLLERFAPPTLIVNGQGDIIYIHGRTGMYLEFGSGEPQHNVLALAREGLHSVLTAALRRAASEDREVVLRGVRVRTNGEYTLVDVITKRLAEPDALRGMFRVSFDSPRTDSSASALKEGGRAEHDAEVDRELQHVRGALQDSLEELQSGNEELKSMNEELQSTNEELQSSNEELQTSKEELKSINEELQTVNTELQNKMDELSKANDDMANLLESTDIATLFLDRHLRIKRFTDLTREVINLIPGDIGRPIGDLVSNLSYTRLSEDARNVLETLRPREIEVQTSHGRWRLVRITPYRTAQGAIEGVAINFLDIDRVKRAEISAASLAVADSIVHTVHAPLAVLDAALNIVSTNPAFLALFELSPPPAGECSLFKVGGGVFATPGMRLLLSQLVTEGTPFQGVPLDHESRDGDRQRLFLNARRLLGPLATPGHVLLALNPKSS